MKSLDFDRCLVDFPYYAEMLLRIKDKQANLLPLKLWDPQWKLHNALEKLRTEGKLQRIIVLKARQEGISTYSEARMFWSAHLTENTDNVVIAHEKESGNTIFDMCRLFYDCLPPQLRPMTRYSSKRELVFENPDAKTRFHRPGMRSSLQVRTAGKKSVSRGERFHKLHASELASWQFPEDVIPALVPTIPKNDSSLVIYESTAKGVNNYFHKEWLHATEGESNFLPFFLAWFDLPEYTRKFKSTKQRDVFMETLNQEEKELHAKHSVTAEQLHWRRVTIADLHGDVELFRQEYPATSTEAFIISGAPIFDRRKLRQMALQCVEPVFRGSITAQGLVPDSRGELRIWKGPVDGGIYCLGVDVADGGEDGDYSCVEVWKKAPAPMFAEQVAEWHGHLDPYNFAHIVERLGRMYKEALVAIETNAHGLATQQEVQRNYWNLYQGTHLDRFDSRLVPKLGWETTMRTKPLLISLGTHCISDMNVMIYSKDLIRECMTFVRDGLSASASGGGYDDRVMASLIGLFAMQQSIEEEPDEELITTQRGPLEGIPMHIDKEFAELLAFGEGDSYEETWLNY